MASHIIELAYNLAVLVALSVVSGFIRQRRGRGGWEAFLQGALFGGVAVVGMMHPLVLGPGLMFDGRSVMISLCGLFFGPWAVAVAATAAALYRLSLGGMGVVMGTLLIAASAAWGLAFHRWWMRRNIPLTAFRLWAFGCLVSATMLLLMFVLPGNAGPATLRSLGLPILLTFPAVTLLVGKILADQMAAQRSFEALRESEAQNRALLNAIPDLVFLVSSDGVYLAAYTSSPGLLYVPLERFLNRNVREVFPPALAEQFQAASAKALASGQRQDLEYRLEIGGEVKCFEARVAPRTKDTVVAIARDVTGQKRSQSALAESEARIRSIVSTSREWIWAVDAQGRFTYSNPAVERLLGYRPEEMSGRAALDLLHEEDRPKVLPFLARSRGEDAGAGPGFRPEGPPCVTGWSDLVLRWKHKDGSFRYTESVAAPIPDGRGGPDGFQGSERDITERLHAEERNRLLQAQLYQAQKMESLGSLAGGVAHDMNNVLGAILGLASAHLEDMPPGAPTRRALETILKAAERGGKMVRSLLNLARQRPAEEKALDLNDLLREEVSLLERTTLARIRLHMDLAPGLPPVLGDASALAHAIMNLCVNAVDAMPGAGTLTLRTRRAGPDWVEAEVEDTGHGMPPEVLEKALDPFFTTKAQGKGTGLGLSLVYSTVKAHGGQMEIYSEPGQGTRITLRLPACAAAAPAPAPAPAARRAQRGFRVLLVDDDELIQNSVQTILQALGHSVTVSPCGEDALAQIEAGLDPEVVLLDMNMPGLGGEGTLPRLRALRPGTPVLLCTGRSDQAAQTLLDRHPGVGILAKPFSMADLRQHLEAAVRG